jgi:hypothetical protein
MTAPTPATAAELREATRAEYGQYVAVVPIDIGGARAFNVGDAVPASHVERGVVAADEVAKTSTKAGRQAAGITDDTPKG